MFGRRDKDLQDEDDDYNFELNADVGLAKPLGTSRGSFRSSEDGSSISSGTAAFRRGVGTANRPPRTMVGRMTGGRQYTSGPSGHGDVRPMTAASRAGYQSHSGGGRSFDPLKKSTGIASIEGRDKNEKDAKGVAKEMEKRVHCLIEESARLSQKKDMVKALEKAKDAGKKERQLMKHRESNSLSDDQNYDLTFATWFNLAAVYQKSGMYEEAMNAYSYLVKQKKHPSSGRLRVNMGNIFYSQGNYSEAIKMYRMALDQIPQEEKRMGFRICRNIGNAFVKLGKYRDAIQSYEAAMSSSPDHETGLNVLLCYVMIGDVEKCKRCFAKIASLPLTAFGDESEEPKASADKSNEMIDNRSRDQLEDELMQRRKTAEQLVITAASLVASIFDKDEWAEGYRWVHDQVKDKHENLASRIEIEQAVQHLRRKEFDSAIKILKAFEKKEAEIRAVAATNLSFLYFLEGNYKFAEDYADIAVKSSRYNAKALVNKGNCLFVKNEYTGAKEVFLEAIGVQADCVQAIYNLGLTNTRLNLAEEASQAFEKLHTIIPNNPLVIYQIANLYEQQNDLKLATKWFNVLATRLPTDPGVLSRLGHIFSKQNDDSQGFHYQVESFHNWPIDLDVISWLGVWFVKNEMYEKSIHFFERAAQIQPNQVKWRLMVTSCYRRMGNYSKALDLYEQIHEENPENIECLRYLVAMCKDVGRPYEEYQEKLFMLDRTPNEVTISSTAVHEKQEGREHFSTQNEAKTVYSDEQKEPMMGSFSAPEPKVMTSQGKRYVPEREEEDFSDADVNDLLA